jgi:hypothetical protein
VCKYYAMEREKRERGEREREYSKFEIIIYNTSLN